MSQIISSSNTEDEKYFDSIRYLIDPQLEDDILSNTIIDSIAYLQYVEDELIRLIPTVLDDDYSNLETAKKYIVYKTALELIYKFPQILQEAELQEIVRYAEIDFESIEKNLMKRVNPLEDILGIPKTSTSVSVKAKTTRSRLC